MGSTCTLTNRAIDRNAVYTPLFIFGLFCSLPVVVSGVGKHLTVKNKKLINIPHENDLTCFIQL